MMLVVYQRRQAIEHFHSSASKKLMEEPRSRSPVELKKLWQIKIYDWKRWLMLKQRMGEGKKYEK